MSRLGTTAHGCRFPAWKDEAKISHRYCGKPVQQGSPYCATHHRLCYQHLRHSASEPEHHARAEAEYAAGKPR